MHKFSIAMSVYKNDTPEWLALALESVLIKQTIKPSEVVLVIDGPVAEDLDKVIDRFTKGEVPFNIIRLNKNQGLGNALRLAVNNAKYPLIARMDSDDISLPNRFETELKLFDDDSSLDVVGGDITEFINEPNNIVAKRSVPQKDREIKEFMRIRCPINHVSAMFKRESVIKCGNYIDLFWNEDYYLWIRMVKEGCKMANTGEIAVNVRTGLDMYKRRGGIKYFKSEVFLQKYMLKNGMINVFTYLANVSKRVIIQLLMPPTIRGWVFKKFARS